MTTDNAQQPSSPASPASSTSGGTGQTVPAPAPAPAQGGAPYADHEAAVRRDAASHADYSTTLSPSEIQAQAKALRDDPKSALWQGDGEEHARAVAVNFRAHQLDAETEEMSTSQKLQNRSMNLAGILPDAVLANPKIVDSDNEMKNLVSWADSEGVATPVLRDLIAEAANHGIAAGPLSEQALDSLEQKFRGRMRPDQIRLLRKWASTELNDALRREAARRGRR